MKLFHLTNGQNAGPIIRDRSILNATTRRERGDISMLTGTPVRHEWDKLNEDVIWLTSFAVPRQAWQVDDFKHQVRFTVDAEAVGWTTFCRWHSIPKWYRQELEYRGTKPATWYVAVEPITADRWVSIELTETGETVWTADDGLDKLDQTAEVIEEMWGDILAKMARGEIPLPKSANMIARGTR